MDSCTNCDFCEVTPYGESYCALYEEAVDAYDYCNDYVRGRDDADDATEGD